MTTWWYAACDAHRVVCPVMILRDAELSDLVEDYSYAIDDFLREHAPCGMRVLPEEADDVLAYRDVTELP